MKTYTYATSSYTTTARIEPHSRQDQVEGHPSPVNWETVLVSMAENGETGIYQIRPYYEPALLTGPEGDFNGQPAAGPVWWQPNPEASREWLATHP
jgi:hypothetical protein